MQSVISGGPGTEGQLLGQSRSFIRWKAAAQLPGKPHGVGDRRDRLRRGEGLLPPNTHQVPCPFDLHAAQRIRCARLEPVANIICLDFDDTIVLENTARLIFERYASPSWREFEAQYHAGRLSVEQFNAAALETVEASRGELQAFVAGAVSVRTGFLELLDWAHWNGWLPVVVSNGFDFYVDVVLDGLGADRLARHAGRTSQDYRWRVTYYSPRGIALEEGFKLSYAAAFQNSGDFVAYVGDGESDVAAARLAQAVFARSTLLEKLDGVHAPVYGFESFHDVVEVLARESEGWLQGAAVSS